MSDFFRSGRELPPRQNYARLIIQNKIKSKTNLILSDHEESEGEDLTSDEKNSYASYLASIIYDYQLKYVSICLLIFLTMLSFDCAYAQETTQSEIVPLKTGDTIPEALWNMPLHVINHPEGKDTIWLRDFRDKKLIILDFWATWCGSCISAFPKIVQLSDELSNRIAIIANSEEAKDKVINFLNGSTISRLSTIPFTLSKEFNQYFPHRFLPHYIWIKDNVYIGSTASESITKANVIKILSSENSFLNSIKEDYIEFDRWKFYANDSRVLANTQYGSTILKHISGINGTAGQHLDSISEVKRYYFNNIALYQLYSASIPSVGLENLFVSQELRMSFYKDWTDQLLGVDNKDRYCYEQITSKTFTDTKRRRFMRFDLDRYFHLESKPTRLKLKVLTLIGIPKPIQSTDIKYIKLDQVIRWYNRFMRLKIDDSILRARSNGGVKVPFSFLEIKSADELLLKLKYYGFEIVSEHKDVEMLLITTPDNQN